MIASSSDLSYELRANISLENSTDGPPRAVLRFLRAKVVVKSVPVSSSRVSKPRLNIYFSTVTRSSSYQTSLTIFSLSNHFQKKKPCITHRSAISRPPDSNRKTWENSRRKARAEDEDPESESRCTSPEANWNWNRCCRPRGLSSRHNRRVLTRWLHRTLARDPRHSRLFSTDFIFRRTRDTLYSLRYVRANKSTVAPIAMLHPRSR